MLYAYSEQLLRTYQYEVFVPMELEALLSACKNGQKYPQELAAIGMLVTTSSVRRALNLMGWSNKRGKCSRPF